MNEQEPVPENAQEPVPENALAVELDNFDALAPWERNAHIGNSIEILYLSLKSLKMMRWTVF